MYCIGDTTEFRDRRGDGVVYCDNDEMAPAITSAGVRACHLADGEKGSLGYIVNNSRRRKTLIPFGTFTILEYVRYSRALVDEKQLPRHAVQERIKRAGLKRKLGCKLRKLTPVEYRALCFAVKVDESTHSAYVNFEGLKYRKKTRTLLRHFLNTWGEKYKVYALVSDVRFVPKKAANG